MADGAGVFRGGCLCGRLRFEADGPPIYMGLCFCADCRKASGAGSIPFMGFPAAAVRVSGESRQSVSRAFSGGEAVRNFCPSCGGLVFGGIVGVDDQHTIYAGALDDPSGFVPQMAIFDRDRPAWAPRPEGIPVFETMPQGPRSKSGV